MQDLLICYASPLPGDRTELPNHSPDYALVFWADYCVLKLRTTLEHKDAVGHWLCAPETSLQDVLRELRNKPVDILVVFGHGIKPEPPAPRAIMNRRHPPSDVLYDESVLAQGGRASQFLLACYSFLSFQEAAVVANIPLFVGFKQKYFVPKVGGTFEEAFSKVREQELLIEFFQIGLIEPIAQLLSTQQQASLTALLQRCQNRLQEAADECDDLAEDTSNNQFSSIAEGLRYNAISLSWAMSP